MKPLLVPVMLVFLSLIQAQPQATPADLIEESLLQKAKMAEGSIVKNIRFKNIGPTVMSGRVVDIDANPDNPIEFYAAYASGGLWYTQDNGISFIPVLDSSQTQNIGDIAVNWKTGEIWVGTGENNASRSSYPGIGIIKSDDKGKNWKVIGLTDSHHIGRILINPQKGDEVVIGVTGHLYSPNTERGVYKTRDGGKSWSRKLFIDEHTGIIDLAHAPDNFNVIYAAAWEKDRKAWNFRGSGKGSAIYKSVDAGDSWQKITGPDHGFPIGDGVGRIGLAAFDENTIYAVLDNQFRRDKTKAEDKKSAELDKEIFRSISAADFLKLEDKKLDAFLKKNDFPEKYRASGLKSMVRDGTILPEELAKYLEDANSMLFETPVIGAEVYLSTDGGKSWTKTNERYLDDLYYSYGYYFGEIRVDPQNKDKIYLGGVPLICSDDGGKTFRSLSKENVHSDHQALWLNPGRSGHLINGNDGGLNMSYDDGAHWNKLNSTPVGQFYAINVDNQKPYHIYGGLQDNGVWMGPHTASQDEKWRQTGHNPWKSILGGDGMQVQVDTRNPDIVYTGFQFGNYYRLNLDENKKTAIKPKHDLGESPFRFNWQTPILLSPHNQDILYLGSNKMHRSMDQGRSWETISDDLTQGGRKGNVAYGTLTALSESPLQFGLLYAGSDDGLIHLSRNAGGNWEMISSDFPKNLWVSRLVASRHKKERVYASLNGYRWDDFTPYIFKSEDYGKTWGSITGHMPLSPVNVILEDTENENLLFAGTDNGLYVSFDQGNTWELFQNGIPNVAVHDLVIQPEARHLIAGTHGRSIYKADISVLQKMTPKVLAKALHLFDLSEIKHSENWGDRTNSWKKPNTPGLEASFYSKQPASYTVVVRTADGIEVSSASVNADKGINIASYDLAFSKKGKASYLKKYKTNLKEAGDGKTYLPKGSYEMILSSAGTSEVKTFRIK